MQGGLLQKDIRYLKGVGENRARLFAKLGVGSVGALLRYFPRGYVDYRNPIALSAAPNDANCAVRVTIASKLPPARTKGGKTVSRVKAFDGGCDLNISYFNNRFTPDALAVGQSYVLYGRFYGGLRAREAINPILIRDNQQGSLTPIYPLTGGLSSAVVAGAVRNALAEAGGGLAETLPEWIINDYSLMGVNDAFASIHFPKSEALAREAKRRFIFEELLTLQLGFAVMKSTAKKPNGTAFVHCDCAPFAEKLPFRLTAAQNRAIAEMTADLEKRYPMNRLLQGDVGSGKTVVAAAGIYCAFKNKYQSAVMAPTEILAAQHADTLQNLLAPFGISVGLLTAAVKGKARALLLEKIKSGEVSVVVGTHAVIEGGVEFKKLAFVVADEQHRFGVSQRLALAQKGDNPHMLVMSATPIPRTLALIIYGELDISVLDELPSGRRAVKTYLVDKSLRARYLEFVRKNCAAGNCSYIVCPLVEDSEAMTEVESASEYFEEIKKLLPDCPAGLLHGKQKPAEKKAVIDRFRSGETKVLVCTTVVEVGVDVPDATVMIIENAERFGLSQLHQLRGRVGRSDKESFCVLVSDSRGSASFSRLKTMCDTNDGFEIARQDLKNRGPGDFFGKRQHGLPALDLAASLQDETVLRDSSAAAGAVAGADPTLSKPEHSGLRDSVSRMFGEVSIFN